MRLSSLGDQWYSILLRSLPSHRLNDWLREPRLPRAALPPWGLWAGAAGVMMGPMFRIVDVEGAWRGRRVAPVEPVTVGLQVGDAQIRENSGSWTLRIENGRVDVEPGETPSVDLHLELDISTLSRLFIGSLPATAALGAELLRCDRPDLLGRLDAALRLPDAWTFDRF